MQSFRCGLFAVLKIFETFNFPYLLKECYRTHFIQHYAISVTQM